MLFVSKVNDNKLMKNKDAIDYDEIRKMKAIKAAARILFW